jgi:UDP:flavonoid glycosyltransferase YjiC (YdhE family)
MIHDTGLAAAKTGGSTSPLRVLMAYWDGGGNVPPQRALARALKRRGHDVHVLTHDSQASAVALDGTTFHALATARQWNPARPNTAAEEGAFIGRDLSGSAHFAGDFLATHAALRPDVCLIDAMLLSTIALALERGMAFAVVNHLAWITGGDVAGHLNAVAAAVPGPAAGSTFLGLLERAPLVLATSYPEFGTRTSTAPPVHFVGPIREPIASEPWPRRFPDRPFVLVSLSSTFQGQESTLHSICQALAPLPLEVLVTTGRGFDPATLPIAGGLEAHAFVPHDAVLPSVDLVVTHAGLGTLMYSAGVGVPCLCFPNGRDQNDNAARVEALGLGRQLSPDATPAEIGDAVMAMLSDQAVRATCQVFAARVNRFGDLARAAELVEELARVTSV